MSGVLGEKNPDRRRTRSKDGTVDRQAMRFAPASSIQFAATPSNPGFALMLILIGLAGLTLAIGFVTPVPERVRRRDRLG